MKKPPKNVRTIAEAINTALSDWPGSCHKICKRMLEAELLPDGATLVSGKWLGTKFYGKYRDEILAWSEDGVSSRRHTWIELADGTIVDPTRYVFEGAKPYIYIGVKDEYEAEEDEAPEQATRVIEILKGRKGFDWWWHDIDADTKREILQEIQRVIEEKTNE